MEITLIENKSKVKIVLLTAPIDIDPLIEKINKYLHPSYRFPDERSGIETIELSGIRRGWIIILPISYLYGSGFTQFVCEMLLTGETE